ncbi:MAG: TonB-dependent receptor [Bacteroidia bacterium]|nr:TonB-dependent receptor [Bacteroidia bacterium]
MKRLKHPVLFLVWLAVWQAAAAQTGTVKGRVMDPDNRPVADAFVSAIGADAGDRTDAEGRYQIVLPAGRTWRIRFSHNAYRAAEIELRIEDGRIYDQPVKLLLRETETVTIIGEKDPSDIDDRNAMLVSPIRMEEVVRMPVVSPSIESLMKNMPGVVSNNEFSSQYQVRGGNFDENLVYVNGIEIYRPFLARSGQQEGLGFSNPSMAQGLQFSTGGFGAQYGDRLSSVLDVTYRTPKQFRASAEVGVISTNLHAEGVSPNRKQPGQPGRFTWLLGARRFEMGYFLNSLDVRGEYRPSYLDIQGMATFTPSRRAYPERIYTRRNGQPDTLFYADDKLKFTGFFAATRNRYYFEPTGRETTTGTILQAFRLRTAFEGREISAYTTTLGALMLEHKPSTRLEFSYILTAFRTDETERFDVEGGYLLGEVNTNLGSDEFNEAEFDLGIGTQYRHARNFLTAEVLSAEATGRWSSDNASTHRLTFGIKAQAQFIRDQLKEYSFLDSAGYLVDERGQFGVEEFIEGAADLRTRLYKAFVQDEWQLSPRALLILGSRLIYYDLNGEWMFSPRGQLLIRLRESPDGGTGTRLRVAAGLYHQPPFYRELRRFDGSLNLDLPAQRSLHLIAGLDHRFIAWGRPFRLFSELYYKRLYNLIPYEVDNIRIRYYPDLQARGYAYGADLRVNGEFIRGVDSWFSLGLLKTSEDVLGDTAGFVPRPTDQRVTAALYFQDELPINPTYKVHVNFVYGSGLRFGPPRRPEFRTAFTFPPYHRVDIGFSKLITFRARGEQRGKRGVESIWATVEIFNLLARANTVSYVWVKDLQNNRYSVNNYLSARLLNARVVMRFW